jgi:hypothetical protein
MNRLPPLGIIAVVPLVLLGLGSLLGSPVWSGLDGFLLAYGVGIALFALHRLARRE